MRNRDSPGMSLITEIRELLRRPLTPPIVPTATEHKRKGVTAPVAADEAAPVPVTEGDVIQALQRSFAERQRAEEEIATASTRRDALMEADDDEALLAVDREVNLAMLQIERLDRLDPRLMARLREVRLQAKADRFAALRDRLIEVAASIVPELEAAAAANEKWRIALDSALADFPDARGVLPGLVSIFNVDVQRFKSDIHRLRTTVRNTERAQRPRTAADMIRHCLETGMQPSFDNMLPWSGDVANALQKEHRIVMLMSVADDKGRPIKAGVERGVPFDEAQRLVTTGKARWADAKA